MALLRIAGGGAANHAFSADKDFGFDLRMRRNEIRCAHQGVNPFRIWNGEVSLPGFAPWCRPHQAKAEGGTGSDALVQGYSPWHTAFFWFYGWLPEVLCLALMSAVFGACLVFIATESLRLAESRFGQPSLVAGLSLAIISLPAAICFMLLNYSVLVLAAFLLMNKALEKNRTFLAGLAWAVMMIKPQVGLLFVWPLFWHRRYLTIATAAVVCLAGTVFMSFAVHDSVIDLILQPSEIGRMFGFGPLTDKIVVPLLGDWAALLVPAFFFALVGALTWTLRKNRDFLVSWVPVVLAIPLWTYGQAEDRVILLPACLFAYGQILSARRSAVLTVAGCLLYAEAVFSGAWSLTCGLGLISPSGLGWVYYLAECSSYALMLAIAARFVRDSQRASSPASVHPNS